MPERCVHTCGSDTEWPSDSSLSGNAWVLLSQGNGGFSPKNQDQPLHSWQEKKQEGVGTWEIPAQFKETFVPRECSWHWTWSPERVRDLHPRTVKPQLHRLMNPALLWATAGLPGVSSQAAWLSGLQSGGEDPVKSKQSSKICICQKQEQFPQCSSGSHPSKPIQKRWTKDKAKTGTTILLSAVTPLLHPCTTIWPKHQEGSCLSLFHFQSPTSEQMKVCYHRCQVTPRTHLSQTDSKAGGTQW